MKYIHLECLRSWIKQRINIFTTPISFVITWKSFNCELCHDPYPFAVYYNGTIYEFIKHKVPKRPYIILEHSSKESQSIIVISFNTKKTLRIGRHIDNDIRINDLSVSRYQATLRWKNASVYLEDKNSKFGTQILIQQPHIVIPEELWRVQYEQIIMEFYVEKSWSLFSYFFNPKAKKKLNENVSITPERCLPSEGKHKVLVIKRGNYKKFIRKEEKIKRAITPNMGRSMTFGKRSVLKDIKNCFMSKCDEHPKIRKMATRISENFVIRKLMGDNADEDRKSVV